MKNTYLIFLVTSLFVIVVAWIAFSIYHNFTTSRVSDSLTTQIQTINPTFDTNTINNLKQRVKVVPIFDVTKPETATLSSVILPSTPTVKETLTISPTVTPVSTEGAVLLP